LAIKVFHLVYEYEELISFRTKPKKNYV